MNQEQTPRSYPADLDGGYLRLAIRLAREDLARSHPDLGSAPIVPVWQCKALQNRKYVLAAPSAGVLYEVTYSGDAGEWYVDRYLKEGNSAVAPGDPAYLPAQPQQAPARAPHGAREAA